MSIEEENGAFWLQPETQTKNRGLLIKHCITHFAEEISLKPTGVDWMLQNNKIEELNQCYELFAQDLVSVKHIINKFTPYVIQRGQALIQDTELVSKHEEFITKLSELLTEIKNLVKEAFRNSFEVQKAMN
jgi:hypothetical protein